MLLKGSIFFPLIVVPFKTLKHILLILAIFVFTANGAKLKYPPNKSVLQYPRKKNIYDSGHQCLLTKR